ncbi:MAG: hypothetical protein PHY26_00090, partial [Bacilli bacterium]|nr:hypothetical protein [Bacilli bacterium]
YYDVETGYLAKIEREKDENDNKLILLELGTCFYWLPELEMYYRAYSDEQILRRKLGMLEPNKELEERKKLTKQEISEIAKIINNVSYERIYELCEREVICEGVVIKNAPKLEKPFLDLIEILEILRAIPYARMYELFAKYKDSSPKTKEEKSEVLSMLSIMKDIPYKKIIKICNKYQDNSSSEYTKEIIDILKILNELNALAYEKIPKIYEDYFFPPARLTGRIIVKKKDTKGNPK